MKLQSLFMLLVSLGLLARCVELGAATPDQWPRFRGADGTGITGGEKLLPSWTTEDWTWQVDLPGIGHS